MRAGTDYITCPLCKREVYDGQSAELVDYAGEPRIVHTICWENSRQERMENFESDSVQTDKPAKDRIKQSSLYRFEE